MNLNLWHHTPGEQIWLCRKSRGETMKDFSALIFICPTTLWRIETDHPRPAGITASEVERNLPPAALPYGIGLLCTLARRRSGLGLAGTARSMGCSRVTVLAREAVGAPEIVNFWRNQGFRFPSGKNA